MEISPITGIRALPAIKAPAAISGLSAVFGVEYLARTRDESYSPNRGKSPRGLEDEADELEDESEIESKVYAAERGLGRKVSFFA
jgi:hypothetical protein